MRLAYRVLFAAAVASLPRRYRTLLGLRRTPLPVITTTRIVLAISTRALGSGPRAQDFARRRHERLQDSANVLLAHGSDEDRPAGHAHGYR